MFVFLRADSVLVYESEGRGRLSMACNYILDYLGLRVADKIWANIGLVRANVLRRYRLPESKIGVLYNNIDGIRGVTPLERSSLRKGLGIREDEFMISTSGIFYKRKNIAFLIRAFHRTALYRNSFLVIIGDDVSQANERVNLERLVDELKLERSVIFTGWRTDSAALIGASDLYVLPTLHEGFPNSLLDAMSVGCACMGSRISEIGEVLSHEELLFDINSEQELSGKLSRAISDPIYLALLKRLTIIRAESFCFDWNAAIVDLIAG